MKSEDRVSILAVDDSPEKLLALSALLAELDENVVTATSGREALRFLLQQEFAVVLLDVNMPGMDGFETAALIRQRKNSEHTPIIFITAYGDDMHALRGYSLGAVDYILAPVEPGILKTKVMVFADLFRKTAQVKQQARTLEQRAAQLQKLTQASLAINSALSPDRMLQVVTALALDILRANQAAAVVSVDQKWSAAKTAVALSDESLAESPILRDRPTLLAFLSRASAPVRVARGNVAATAIWPELLGSDASVRLGWLAAPMTARDGLPMGLLHVLDKREGDFTEEDEGILTQLAQMSSIAIENAFNAEAREANRIKDEFLTMLSHELRTPLSAILGWTRILRSGSLDGERLAQGLDVIERNVVAQTKLIDDLLDVSRIITGKLRLAIRPVALVPIIEAAMEAMRPATEAKDIQVVFDRRVRAGEGEVVGDSDRLQQIVWNLLSNAIKFTPPRGRVSIELARGEGQFQIRVRDTGKGIAPEFLPHVFERFRQADSSSTRSHAGLGIGLAIVRHLVELHGGSVEAESLGEGLGSVFSICLPTVAVGIEPPGSLRASASEVPKSSPAAVENLGDLRVLVVEDDSDGRELLCQILRGAGARVEAVGSAAEALLFLGDHPVEVLVSDIGMPQENGYSLIERLRQRPFEQGGSVPALAVSAYARQEDRLRALAAGFQRHLAKPFEPADLVSIVARLGEGRDLLVSTPRDASDKSEERMEAPAAASREGGPSLRVLVVEDDTDSRDGLRNLLEIWGHAVEVAETGVQGVEKAIESRPGVALIDIELPEIDGYEVALRIRRALGQKEIYLVALTGYADAASRERALAAGFDAHVAKPIDTSALGLLLASRLPN